VCRVGDTARGSDTGTATTPPQQLSEETLIRFAKELHASGRGTVTCDDNDNTKASVGCVCDAWYIDGTLHVSATLHIPLSQIYRDVVNGTCLGFGITCSPGEVPSFRSVYICTPDISTTGRLTHVSRGKLYVPLGG
jgi:hypothetical protein